MCTLLAYTVLTRDQLRNTMPGYLNTDFQWVLSLDSQRGLHAGIVTLMSLCCKNSTISQRRYPRHQFPIDVIGQCVWPYFCFSLSDCDVELMMAGRSLTVSFETVRRWFDKFGREYFKRPCRSHGSVGGHWHLYEGYEKINGLFQYL